MDSRPLSAQLELESLESAATRAHQLIATGERRLLGITGPPGAGKSTLAEALRELLRPDVALVPMDGFHLSMSELRRIGLADRIGAIDTFDANAFVALMRRLRDGNDDLVYAPGFDRRTESPVPEAILVSRQAPLVITEGNYLLANQSPWNELRMILDEVWFLELDEEVRLRRLIDRHVSYGKSLEDAAKWSSEIDQRNAQLVDATRSQADVIVRLDPARDSG